MGWSGGVLTEKGWGEVGVRHQNWRKLNNQQGQNAATQGSGGGGQWRLMMATETTRPPWENLNHVRRWRLHGTTIFGFIRGGHLTINKGGRRQQKVGGGLQTRGQQWTDATKRSGWEDATMKPCTFSGGIRYSAATAYDKYDNNDGGRGADDADGNAGDNLCKTK